MCVQMHCGQRQTVHVHIEVGPGFSNYDVCLSSRVDMDFSGFFDFLYL